MSYLLQKSNFCVRNVAADYRPLTAALAVRPAPARTAVVAVSPSPMLKLSAVPRQVPVDMEVVMVV